MNNVCNGQEYIASRNDYIGPVGLKLEFLHSFFYGQLVQAFMQFVQYFHRNSLLFLVFLFRQTIKFVDVSTRTDDVRTGVRNSQFLHILFQPFPFSFLYGIVQNTYCTDVVRTAAYEFSL